MAFITDFVRLQLICMYLNQLFFSTTGDNRKQGNYVRLEKLWRVIYDLSSVLELEIQACRELGEFQRETRALKCSLAF